jgi:hypothetical protein
MAPLQISRRGIVGSQESTHSRITAGGTDDDCPFHNERGAGRAVVFGFVGIFNIPSQATGASVEAEQVGVVGFHVNKMLPQSHPAILVSRGVVKQP